MLSQKYRCFIAAMVAMFWCSNLLIAASFGDVDVVIEQQPSQTATHGYAELWVVITNRSKADAREVRLTLPRQTYSSGEDHLRSVARTITVDPGKTARVSLMYPVHLPISGDGLGVTIDGREQRDTLTIDSNLSTSSRYRSYSFGSSTHSSEPTVLYSRGVNTSFPDWIEKTRRVMTHISYRPGVRLDPQKVALILEETGPATSPIEGKPNLVRAEAVANWSPNWLGYSRYDGIVLTSEELRSMPEEVRSAIGQYVECGGSLLVLGKDPPLPGKWKLSKPTGQHYRDCQAGFGDCIVTEQIELSNGSIVDLIPAVVSWSRVQRPFANTRSAAQANTAFPIVEDISFPTGGLLAVMFIFSILAGPVTLFVLARQGRKLWLFWIVPLISAATCLMVFGYMALSEGWSGRSRITGITILDQNTGRASSLGWTAFYTPMSVGSGLHFNTGTELTFQNGDENDYYSYRHHRSSSALSIDWSNDQHLTSGWLSPRVPAHFVVRKSEKRLERVTFSRGADGRPEALNGLGADLTDLWYADEGGKIFHAQNIAAGAKVSLDPIEKPAAKPVLKSIADIYGGEWNKAVEQVTKEAPALLKPRTYLAVMEAAPFFDQGLENAKTRQAQSVVFGIIREGGDEG